MIVLPAAARSLEEVSAARHPARRPERDVERHLLDALELPPADVAGLRPARNRITRARPASARSSPTTSSATCCAGRRRRCSKGREEAIKRYPFIDATRQAAIGASYGGYLMNWFNGHTNQFRAWSFMRARRTTSRSTASTTAASAASCGWAHRCGKRRGSGWIRARSATPRTGRRRSLITQGEIDFRVPLNESITTFKLLQRQKVAVTARDLPRRRALDPEGREQPPSHAGSDGVAEDLPRAAHSSGDRQHGIAAMSAAA